MGKSNNVFLKKMLHYWYLSLVIAITGIQGPLYCASWNKAEKEEAVSPQVDMVIYSFDRPLQLFALLESIEKYINGLREIRVIYRASNNSFNRAYHLVNDEYPHVKLVKQGDYPRKDFKPLTLEHVFESNGKYVLFAVDDIIVTGFIDLNFCVHALEEKNAYAFFLRLGDNITHMALGKLPQPKPNFTEMDDRIRVWKFAEAEHDWRYAHTVDLTLYKKSDIERQLRELDFFAPNRFETVWAGAVDVNQYGICFKKSKMINIPVNRVQTENNNVTMNLFSTEELLNKFYAGLKIDINKFYNYENNAPHTCCSISFIERN